MMQKRDTHLKLTTHLTLQQQSSSITLMESMVHVKRKSREREREKQRNEGEKSVPFRALSSLSLRHSFAIHPFIIRPINHHDATTIIPVYLVYVFSCFIFVDDLERMENERPTSNHKSFVTFSLLSHILSSFHHFQYIMSPSPILHHHDPYEILCIKIHPFLILVTSIPKV